MLIDFYIMKKVTAKHRRQYTSAELEIVSEYLIPFREGAKKAVEQARLAVKIAPCQMTIGQLLYWQSSIKFMNWVDSTISRRQEKLINNG